MPIIIRSPKPAIRAPSVLGLRVVGMHGMGDNLHQRAIVRELMRTQQVFLETPWPAIYHDLVGSHLKLVRKPTALRTQAKNVLREASKYEALPGNIYGMRTIRIWYQRDDVLREGSILGAMCAGAKVRERDFSLPVPETWQLAAARMLRGWPQGKPLLLYRPLVTRPEWGGCAARNPDYDAYYELFQAIREDFYVVSVADLVPAVEWMVGHPIKADVEFHRGELTFEALAALTQRASMVYASPGFAPLLAQAVGTPSVCVFGGHESALTISGGAHLAPTLGIDPIEPCNCFVNNHQCRKAIDLPRAIAAIQEFACASRS